MFDEESLGAMDVAHMLHVGRNKVYELAQSGELPSYRIGRKIRFSSRDVQLYLESRHRGIGVGSRESKDARDESIDRGTPYLSSLVAGNADFIVAGMDVTVGMLASSLCEAGLPSAHRNMNGFAALVGLYLGDVDVAVADLYDARTNGYNIAFVERLAPGTSVVVITLLERERGFAVAHGNPLKITTWGGLLKEGVRLAQQPHGTGGRVLLDEKLSRLEARSEMVAGYGDEPMGEYAAVDRVAQGACDVAICCASSAARVGGVDFVPMQSERLDIIVRKSSRTRALVKAVKQLVGMDGFRKEIEAVSSGDCRRMGAVIYES